MVARRSDIATYIVVAYALAWVLASIPWIDGKGLESIPWLHDGAALMMFAPTVAVLVVRWRQHQPLLARPAAPGLPPASGFAADIGLGLGPSPARTARLIVAAWFGVPMVAWIAYEISAALGWFHFDLSTVGTNLVVAMIIESLTTMIVGAVPLTLGEEIGWRGWLLPHVISRFGTPVALIATGVIWALWHAPLTLLGYGFTDIGAWSALAYIPFCVTFGAVLGWLRLRSGSIWPAAVGHAAWNAGVVVFGALKSTSPDEQPHTLLTGSGVTGWILWAAVAAALFVFAPVARTPAPALRTSVQT
ncbi:CPBP family intramembrane glutamic endopeptidase [Nocardia nova]|nr:CPBP family intramembrane glutamic endopeptidase [Nocardia nova]